MASISSMKIIEGAFFFAFSKRSRTRLAPTPTNISTNSEPDKLKNATPASPATARARRVFPVPGGPMSKTPFGIRPPNLVNFFGSLRKLIISTSSSFDSSTPATSAKVTWCPTLIFALLFPKFMIPPIPPALTPPPILRIKKIHMKMKSNIGAQFISMDMSHDVSRIGLGNILIFGLARKISINAGSAALFTKTLYDASLPSLSFTQQPVISLPPFSVDCMTMD